MKGTVRYVPGTYGKRVPDGTQLAEQAILEWEKKRLKQIKERASRARVTNCISFSRKIGVGALEVADIVAGMLEMKVADRVVLEHIAQDRDLREKTIDGFDERYPGAMREFSSLLFGEKSFTMGDYNRYLAAAVYSLADAAPTVFVGRATHLILPRERVLAVRFIASREYRVRRLAQILDIAEDAADLEINSADKEQRLFFKKNFGKNDASPYEFDLIINRDFLGDAQAAAEIVAKAYRAKFGEK